MGNSVLGIITRHNPSATTKNTAPFNKIRRLAVAEAYASLHPSCPPAFSYDESLYDSICEVLNAILTNVPVYHLACLPDADAARLSYETIFGTCEK